MLIHPPIPAVTASFSLGAFSMRSGVRYAGQKGVVMSCSTSRTEKAQPLVNILHALS